MNYAAARPQIRSGDLLAWSGSTIWSRIIRRWTGEDITHVGVAWVVGGRVLALEVRLGYGVSVRPLSNALPCGWTSLNAPHWEKAEWLALSYLGKPYSIMDAIRVGFGLSPKKWNGFQCAEYVSAITTVAGCNAANKFNLTPGQIVTTFKNAGCALNLLTKET